MTPPTSQRRRHRGAGGSGFASVSLLARVALAWMAICAIAWGQTSGNAAAPMTRSTGPNTAAAPTSPTSASAAETESPPSEETEPSEPVPFAFVKPEDGTYIPLPPGVDYEDFIKWIAAKKGPGYGVNSVEVTGEVREGELIELQAAVTIVVLREDEWVRVPLGFQEAVLGDVQHEGKGSSVYDNFTETEGHAWNLRGMGPHRLLLTLLAPLTNELDETRLTLTTPKNAATTTLRLNFAGEFEANAEGGVLRESRPTEETTAIEWKGAGGRIALAWHPRPETALPEDLTVSTSMVVSLTSQECEIRARQTIMPAKGRIANVEIRLPEGFSFLSVEGEYYRPGTARLSKDGRIVSLDLKEPQAGPVELNWRLAAPLQDESPLTISDFSIPDVPETAQSGEIKFEKTAAYTVDVLDDEGATTGVSQTGMIEPGAINVALAYEFERQPFALAFDVKSVTPSFKVSPELIFTIQPERVDLDATFGVSVEQGELKEMRFVWPAEGWNVTRIRTGYIQETKRSTDQSPPIEIQVPNGIPFEIPILATMRRESLAGSFTVPLPHVEAMSSEVQATREDRVLAIRYPNNLKVEARAADGAMLPEPDASLAVQLPQPSDTERMSIFQVPTTVEEIQFEVKQIQQQITTDTTVTVRPRSDVLVAEQRFDYGVRYEPLSILHFRIPESLFEQDLEFIDGSGVTYHPDEVSRAEGFVEAAVHLATSIQGQISLTTRFHVTPGIERAKSGTFAMPVISPMDGTLGMARLEVAPLPYHQVAIDSPAWQAMVSETDAAARLPMDGSDRWQSSSLPATIPLSLTARPPEAVLQPTLSKVLLRSVIEREGRVSTVVDGLLDRPATLLILEFPAGAQPQWFQWRGRPLKPEITKAEGRTHAALALEDGAGMPVLSFEYELTTSDPLGFLDRERIPTVDFGDDLAIDEVVWRVSLPESEHLFTNPAGYVPRFEWQLDQGFWSRETVPSLREMEGWFGAELTAMRPEFESGHEYVFSREGSVAPLGFSVVAKSLVVLIGAGLAILLGYTFANGLVPHPRYVLPGMAVAALLAWAFFPSQVQLFLQPAILGLFLVGAALVAERVLQRRQERLAAAASNSAVDFVTILPGDGSTSAPQAGIGSEEPTVVRANAGPDHGRDS